MASIFTKIIEGAIPAYKVAEDGRFIAFLDIFPIAKGHVLVVPKQEVDYIFDLDDEWLADMVVFAKKVAAAMRKTISCKRIGMSVVGLEVPHAHIHLVPINKLADIEFSHPKLEFTPDEFKQIAARIRENIDG